MGSAVSGSRLFLFRKHLVPSADTVRSRTPDAERLAAEAAVVAFEDGAGNVYEPWRVRGIFLLLADFARGKVERFGG
jgi:hypothetical protein